MNKKLFFLIKIFVGISIFSLLIINIGPRNIYTSLVGIKYFSLISIPILFLLLFLGAVNLKILLNPIKRVKLLNLFKYSLIGWSFGIFTPGKIGEFSTSYLLSKKESLNLGESTSILLIDKMITFFINSLIAMLALYLFLPKQFFFVGLLFLIIILMGLLIFFSTEHIREFIKKYILGKYSVMFTGFSKTVKYMFKSNKSLLVLNTIVTISRLFLSAYTTKFVFLALGYNIPIVFLLLINAAIAIGTLMPFTINGLGINDAIYILFLGKLGVGPVIVMAHNVFILMISYLVALFTVIFFIDKKS